MVFGQRPWIVEVDMPGSYLLLRNDRFTTTSDGTNCTRFATYDDALKAAKRYYGDNNPNPLREPHIFQPDWMKGGNTRVY